MNQDPNFWTQWLPASLELHTLQWATLLAAAALLGYVLQRHWHIPKVVGYALVGSGAGLLGLGHTLWPVQGGILLLLQLTMSVVLFECGGRITLRWFRHNPMVLVQSLLEAGLTYGAVFWSLRALGLEPTTACALGLIAMAASPVVLARVVQDMRASGHVTDRALVLATLSTFYALMLGCVQVQWLAQDAAAPWWQGIWPAAQVLLSSAAVALVLCAVMRLALSWMSPLSESTSLLLLCLIAAGADRWLGTADSPAGRHAAQAVAAAPLDLATPAGHGLIAAIPADVCAGFGHCRAGGVDSLHGRGCGGAHRSAPAGQGSGRGAGQYGQRCQLASGRVGGRGHDAHVGRRPAADPQIHRRCARCGAGTDRNGHARHLGAGTGRSHRRSPVAASCRGNRGPGARASGPITSQRRLTTCLWNTSPLPCP